MGDFIGKIKLPFVEPLVLYDEEKNSLGMNVWFLNDWDKSRSFVDAMKHCREWRALEDGSSLSLDPFGWPLGDAQTVFLANMDPTIDDGTYKLVFEGQATVHLDWVGGRVENNLYNEVTNITTCDVSVQCELNSAANLRLTETRLEPTGPPNSGVKNVRLFRPGYPTDGKQTFISPLLGALKNTGVIRTMDWTSTNVNPIINWSERTTPEHSTQARRAPTYMVNPSFSRPLEGAYGVALEYIIQLSNDTDCDLWINIPALANNDYVTKLSQMIAFGSDCVNPYPGPVASPVYPPLKSSLRVYIEYANETWNSAGEFGCFYLIQEIIKNLPGDHPLFSDGTNGTDNLYQNLFKYPAYRLAEISKIFRSTQGDGAMMTRIRPILCTQQGDANATLSLPLIWADSYYPKVEGHPVNYYFYGAGGSAYYGVNQVSTDLDEFLDRSNYPDTQFLANNRVDSTWAGAYGLKRVAYEGGFGLDFFNDQKEIFFSESQMWSITHDPRTYNLMIKTQEAWSQTGGDLLVFYCLAGPGAWGMTSDLWNQNTAKMNAFKNLVMAPRAQVTMGGAIPGTVYITQEYPEIPGTRIVRTGYGYYADIDGKRVLAGNNEGDMLAIPTHSTEAFTGKLRITGNRSNEGSSVLGIRINGEKQGTLELNGTAGLTESTSLTVFIPHGLAIIRVDVESGGYSLYSLNVTKSLP